MYTCTGRIKKHTGTPIYRYTSTLISLPNPSLPLPLPSCSVDRSCDTVLYTKTYQVPFSLPISPSPIPPFLCPSLPLVLTGLVIQFCIPKRIKYLLPPQSPRPQQGLKMAQNRVRTPVHQYTGAQVHRCTSTLVHRYTCIQVHRDIGTKLYGYTSTLVLRYTCTPMHALVHRYIVMIIHRYKGGLVHRFTCTQVHGYIGTPVHWYCQAHQSCPPSFFGGFVCFCVALGKSTSPESALTRLFL